jgi:hypothetical protein
MRAQGQAAAGCRHGLLQARSHTASASHRRRPRALVFNHVNFLGRYAFIARLAGLLRPLRDPTAPDDEDDE